MVILRLFVEEDLGIKITSVANRKLHIPCSLNGSFTIIDDGSLAQMTQETIEALSAISSRQTVDAQRYIKDGKPLVVWSLRHIGLKFFGSYMLVIFADTCPRKQVAAFWNKTRSMAST